MKTDLILKSDLSPSHARVNSALSFREFYVYVCDRILVEKTVKKNFYKYILEQFARHPEWREQVNSTGLQNYELLFELVYASLFAPLNDDNTVLWGLGLPMYPTTFYNTDSLHALLKDGKLNGKPVTLIKPEDDKVRQISLGMAYSLILQRIYKTPITQRNQMIQPYRDEESGLTKYLEVNIDLRFVTVKVKDDRPDLKMEIPSSGNFEDCTIETLQKSIPLDAFYFEGFSVITAKDATENYVMGKIRSTIADQNPEELYATFSETFKLFQSLIGTEKVEFGAIPFLEVNDRIVSPYANHPFSVFMKTANELMIPENDMLNFLEDYRNNPRLLFYEEHGEKSFITAIIHKLGIKVLALLPVFHNDTFVGILEAHTTHAGVFSRRLLAELDHALPLLAQLLHRAIHELYMAMDKIIKEEFTTLQSSVEWKFKEVVWNYMKECSVKGDDRDKIGQVLFDHVYPLYGAIDIRNSTVERSRALKADLQVHFTLLTDLLAKLKDYLPAEWLEEKLALSKKYIASFPALLTTNDEITIRHFLEEDVRFFLNEFHREQPAWRPVLARYFQATDEKSGIAFQNRRRLENSMQLINACVQQDLNGFQKELQKIYPNYFESFRTDGIEYDVYLGQSVAPDVMFNRTFLQEYRMLQLAFMANVVRLTNSLKGQLKIPLQTTQLIFVHESTIDINFRKEEKRFDVEGSYNIRYQILKKRIDKALVKGTAERLTQPGKIAIVYTSDASADEYAHYLSKLQAEKVLEGDVEYLDIEELQGVSGLKALRVTVLVEDENRSNVMNQAVNKNQPQVEH